MKPTRFPRRDKVISALRSLGSLRPRVSHSSVIHVSLILIILSIAFMVRMLPLRWGPYLSEFDPYFHARLAQHMVDEGPFAWLEWQDYEGWYPNGRDVPRNALPGMAYSSNFFYLIARALGFPVALFDPSGERFSISVLFPVMLGTFTVLAVYFLCRDIGGKEAAIFSSLFLALNSSHISRTSLGFSDDETVGIFSMILFFFFFLRSIDKGRPLKTSSVYALAAGLSLGFMCTSWGASRYPIAMTSLFVFILILLRRYTPRLFFSFSVTFGVAFFIPINVPVLGFKFLTETFNLSVLAVFVLLCFCELFRHIRTPKSKIIVTFVFFALAFAAVSALTAYGIISETGSKFWRVLNPFSPSISPLQESVAEHRSAAWGSFYYENGIVALFIPVGLFFTLRNPTNRNLFLSVYALTSLYFASSMIRLTLILAPALCMISAVAIVRLLKPFVTILREAPVISARKGRFAAHVGKEFSAVVLILIFILIFHTFVWPTEGQTASRLIEHAYTPTTIAAGSTGVAATDWIDALEWMRYNLKDVDNNQRVVVASWWDYGYWITCLANKTTLADNGTINSTQIQQIAKMFMSNETEAVNILTRYDAEYVVVFTTFIHVETAEGPMLMDWTWGDEGKWRWMARIGEKDEDDYGTWESVYVEVFNGNRSYWRWNDENGTKSVIYKLMTYAREMRVYGSSTVDLEKFELRYPLPPHYSAPYGGVLVLVAVYEVKY